MSGTTERKSKQDEPSGRFLLRIDPVLHESLRNAARQKGLSLNDLCARHLAAPITDSGGPGSAITASAAGRFGEALLGVVIYGSWARSELSIDSDVDVAVVLENRISITRDLYRSRDNHPPAWYSREVDLHFVHLPTASERTSGLWLELAVEGIVLYDRDLRLSRTLTAIRSEVASGKLARHFAHGQSYWVENS